MLAMNILHLYPIQDKLITQHVEMLKMLSDANHLHELPCKKNHIPDIVHVHGCWNLGIIRQAEMIRKQGARIVLSPHGQLEPWIIAERHLTEKTAKSLLWQRRFVKHAYALIAHGKMEAEALYKLQGNVTTKAKETRDCWNPRIETIANAVVSNSITPEAMSRQTQVVYQKVMDSNTLEHLSVEMKQLMGILLKAGTTGDHRWITNPINYHPSSEEWRNLLLYTEHEAIREVIEDGIRVMGMEKPSLDISSIACYLPTNYVKPHLKNKDVVDIIQHANDNGLTKLHIVELARALRSPYTNDDNICDALDDLNLTRYSQRLLQILKEQFFLEEGFMPLPPLDDTQTQKLRNLITNHLKI
jgi:hypothetical protein